VAVTGIEMVRAISVVANGGYLVTPHVVASIKGDGWNEKIKSDSPIRIISQKAAEETTQMMVQAAERGEAKWCRIRVSALPGKRVRHKFLLRDIMTRLTQITLSLVLRQPIILNL